ncbi:DNA-3-methyladenine glycosylase [Lentibacillus populi]|uniref:DNA-3-methyladenine glycosylase II n=1 Tax=Lentibacillus populi TaxID=1827502 RepID=A0A9W5X647_9BACI|nr:MULTISPECIES: DNA-3-methyladenine glycosylase [Bacillaceae]MBT2216264.1 DNA-3-methyladenine glycosylase [Virgibacillus dakarensis]GGB48852.1 DNA-3-methyladenine glycosylase [Lentibacillus populi]
MEKLIIQKNDQAVVELSKQDPVMGKLITIVGNMEVALRPDLFNSLIRSMIGQQISVAAANAIYNRLQTLMDNHMTPEKIIGASDESLRSIGLSARKILYIRDLANKVISSELNLETLYELDNKQIMKKLTGIKGIGKWTAEMFLIFSLGRMNVLSLDDIGLQRGARWLYKTDKARRRKVLEEKQHIWDPHLTIASFYLWEVVHLDFERRYESIDEMDSIINIQPPQR